MRMHPTIAAWPRTMAEGTGLFGDHSIQPLLTDGSMSISDVSNSLRLSTKAVLCILQKPQYRTTRHYQPAQDRQVAICDKAMQHRHPLIPLPFAVSTMVTRWSLLNCLFCHSALRFWSPVRRLNHHTAERYEHTSCSRHA
jgi:hypothetical protein